MRMRWLITGLKVVVLTNTVIITVMAVSDLGLLGPFRHWMAYLPLGLAWFLLEATERSIKERGGW